MCICVRNLDVFILKCSFVLYYISILIHQNIHLYVACILLATCKESNPAILIAPHRAWHLVHRRRWLKMFLAVMLAVVNFRSASIRWTTYIYKHTWAMHVHKIIHLEIHLSNLILSCLRCLSLSMFVYVSSWHQYFGATLLSDSSLSQTIRRLPQCFTWSDAICQNGHMTNDQKRRNNDAIVVNFNMVNDSVKCSLLVATICQTWQVRRCKLVPQWNFAQTSTPALVELAQVWQRATFKGWRNPIIDLRNILWDHSSVLVWRLMYSLNVETWLPVCTIVSPKEKTWTEPGANKHHKTGPLSCKDKNWMHIHSCAPRSSKYPEDILSRSSQIGYLPMMGCFIIPSRSSSLFHSSVHGESSPRIDGLEQRDHPQ